MKGFTTSNWRILSIQSYKFLSHDERLELNTHTNTHCCRPERVLWTKDGGVLPDVDRMIVEGRELIITNLNKTDNGTYRCEARNHLGTNSDEYVLFVYGEWLFKIANGCLQYCEKRWILLCTFVFSYFFSSKCHSSILLFTLVLYYSLSVCTKDVYTHTHTHT